MAGEAQPAVVLDGAGGEPRDATAAAIIAAARDEFVRYGIRRANVENIARRAGVSRVTVYRRFDSKPALLRAVVFHDITAFTGRFDAVLFGEGSVEERLAEAFLLSVNETRRNPLLTTLARSEPDEVLVQLTLNGKAEFELVAGLVEQRLQALVDRGELQPLDVGQASETLLRLAYTVFLLPFGTVPGKTDAEIRDYARKWLVPLLIAPPSAGV